ncbi:Acetyl-CoA carboxylase biotin carboxylase subunit [Sphingobium herbicidovorans NBRC 16415]|uniref:Pyruvate carboxylase n=1 Tax=Sphingobium herbicidovorans (strain ATCC 700291 / DSM 11019 / CCUG 56400 / KCTC 2939 / LMG 18315 / NBRC 16415 / MH) TaxID=1219045 RepID=A0A086PBX0_SPHHM|nr:pyruvate carboxylase [Sphingobium herbicidovorans]KFG90888.1 Acetyl-CoA carboxylase biotin carboxylase subunit [Sphingobium herbicidovorans NBRC 16415]
MSANSIGRILVANRSEIAIRVFRAATELGIQTVAVFAEEDKLSLHRFKADEAYHLGECAGPIAAYLDGARIIDIAKRAKVDAIHPGYGFLSENPDFAEACAAAGLLFIGPRPETMRQLGDKVSARKIAIAAHVRVVPASDPLPDDDEAIRQIAREIGYPLMLKASWGGGGRGMRPIEDEAGLIEAVRSGKREAKAAFGRDEVYLEKLIRRARHVEVQLLGDSHGNLFHLFERDCSIQRRNQKVIERAPAPYLDESARQALCEAALKIGAATNYVGAGTVEFLMDEADGAFYFIEVNPRIQVEHTVTEMVTGIDVVKAQIRIAEGGRLGVAAETGVPPQSGIALSGHALQCRITTEDPANNFIPDYGRITAYRGAFGYGVRVDGGTAYAGAVVTRHYDPLLEKVTAWAPTPHEVVARMVRSLREYRIRGVATNLPFLENVLTHPEFLANRYTTRFIDETPGLMTLGRKRDRATRLLTYIADVTVNGHPDVKGRNKPPAHAKPPKVPAVSGPVPDGTRQILEREGAWGLSRWVRAQERPLLTDTTMRDAHQSLLATRMRTADMVAIAPAYARLVPQLLSLECWGGATFDVAMRFLSEDPWERLYAIREAAPNLLTQMLLRGANGVGYTNYPDNVVRHFIAEAAKGIDVFRVFDCLNWVENMRVAIDAVVDSGKIAQGALCYTGNIIDPSRPKYSLDYYVNLARQLEAAGCQMLAVKDMAGLLKPAAATVLFKALREVTDLPIALHTHDTSGMGAATLLAAIDAGADSIDAAMDAMSGTTSQPCLGALVEGVKHTERDTGIAAHAFRQISFYWEAVRSQYAAFESDLRSGASEVYFHEMPGGQFTNLKEQARSLGLDTRWHEVAKAYHDANLLFGDIVKVTPSSKVVGDMALMMVAQDLTPEDVLDPAKDIAFPSSVIEMLRGDLGQPPGGWPKALQERVLGEASPITVRPASQLGEQDLAASRAEAEAQCDRSLSDADFASYLMYPKVFTAFAEARRRFGPVSALPTPIFFYGMQPGEEANITIEQGKTLVIQLTAIGEVEEDGMVRLFFELNGQPRVVAVADRRHGPRKASRRVADCADENQIAAPMPGVVSALGVRQGQKVSVGELLLTLEAMKMETAILAPRDGIVGELVVRAGQSVDAKDLLLVLG